jgi:FKBP-type peptidyl-prolyl cis-trans isomerase SlyD
MKITNETTVTINYKVSEKNGNVLEMTEEGAPVIYLQGLEMMLPPVEAALEGKIPGDKVRIELAAEDAFGKRVEDLITKIPSADFEDAAELEIGQDIIVGNGEDEALMTIIEITDDEITLDGNHPFAGKDIIFEIEVIEVHKTTDEDLEEFSHHHDEDCDCGSH